MTTDGRVLEVLEVARRRGLPLELGASVGRRRPVSSGGTAPHRRHGHDAGKPGAPAKPKGEPGR